jgi:phage gpG-like protein
MAVQLEIKEIKPHTTLRAKKKFDKLLQATKDARPVWKIFLSWYRENFVPSVFTSRGKAMGKTWAVYSQSYRTWRKKNAGGKGKLRLTDRLFDAAQGKRESFETLKKKVMTFGIENSLEYAAVHQYGFPKNGIPQRPYLFNQQGDLPPRAWAVLVTMFEDRFEEVFNGN